MPIADSQSPIAEEKPKVAAPDAGRVASALVTVMRRFCERIEVAGSLRRGKEMVGDIEILYIPKWGRGRSPVDLFEWTDANLVDQCLAAMCRAGELRGRPGKKGRFTWGPQNKLAVHVETGIPVDFFATTEANWWVSLVVRTGSKANNVALASRAQLLGRALIAYGPGVKKLGTGEVLEAHSEEEVFELCGVKYRAPKERG